MDVEVHEVVPGEFDVRVGGRTIRVVVPAGVGVPGLADDEFAGGVVVELLGRANAVPDLIDVSGLLRTAPELLDRVADRVADVDGP